MPKLIYRITNTLNGDFYIGKTERGLETRFRNHQYDSLKRNSQTHLHRAMRKYGVDAFKCELLENVNDTIDLSERERYWIGSLSPSYNMTDGGDGASSGRIVSAETRAKLAAVVQSAETRAKRSATMMGRVRSPHSAEARAKISAAGIGRIASPETRAKRSASLMGRIMSPETRAKLSASAIGRKMSAESLRRRSLTVTGRVATTETKQRISIAAKNRPSVSAETRQRMSIAAKARWARRAQAALTT